MQSKKSRFKSTNNEHVYSDSFRTHFQQPRWWYIHTSMHSESKYAGKVDRNNFSRSNSIISKCVQIWIRLHLCLGFGYGFVASKQTHTKKNQVIDTFAPEIIYSKFANIFDVGEFRRKMEYWYKLSKYIYICARDEHWKTKAPPLNMY